MLNPLLSLEQGRIQLIWLNNTPDSLVCDQIINSTDKQWTCFGHWGEQRVLAKIFADEKQAQQEVDFIQSMSDMGVKTQKLLYHGTAREKALSVLLFEPLHEPQNVFDVWKSADDEKRSELLHALIPFIAKVHQTGTFKENLHLKNFALNSSNVYLIELDQVIKAKDKLPLNERQSLKNLGFMFAQLPPRYSSLCATLYPLYIKTRDMVFTLAGLTRLQKWIVHWRKYFLHHLDRKIFHNNEKISYSKEWRRLFICDRGYETKSLHALLAAPDVAMQMSDAKLIKADANTALAKIEVDGRSIVIKRFNPANLWQKIKWALKSSPASRNWRNAHRLKILDIPTPKPIAVLEKRFGPFCLESYFISEYIPGENLQKYVTELKNTEELGKVADNLLGILADLSDMQITHGNLQATNVLINKQKPFLIDLEKVRSHRFRRVWIKAAIHERKQFMQNWENAPELQKVFRLIAPETKPQSPSVSKMEQSQVLAHETL